MNMAETTAPRASRLHQTVVMSRSRGSASDVNVGNAERWVSAVGGSALAVYGLTRGTLGGLALAALGGALVYRGASGHCPVYACLDISTSGERHSSHASVRAGHGVRMEKAITINRPPKELYRFWRNLENLPRVMRHLKSVQKLDHLHSRWVARGPLGLSATWDAEVITENEPEVIGWRSLPGSEVETAGSIHFNYAPDGHGTEVRVMLKYDPPGGEWGAALAHFFGDDPETEIEEDLRRFKQMAEAGET
jgi:uncharacterized membrane protein